MIPDFSRKVPVIVRPGRYIVSLEHTHGLTFVHCDILARWAPALKEALVRDWAAFRTLHEAPILALHTPGDRKHEKFLRMFGFSFLCPSDGLEIYSLGDPHG